jgi:hypothetical protein
MRLTGYITYMGEMINAYKILIEESEGCGPYGRPRHRNEGNINGSEIGYEGVDKVVMNTVINFLIP